MVLEADGFGGLFTCGPAGADGFSEYFSRVVFFRLGDGLVTKMIVGISFGGCVGIKKNKANRKQLVRRAQCAR